MLSYFDCNILVTSYFILTFTMQIYVPAVSVCLTSLFLSRVKTLVVEGHVTPWEWQLVALLLPTASHIYTLYTEVKAVSGRSLANFDLDFSGKCAYSSYVYNMPHIDYYNILILKNSSLSEKSLRNHD